MTSRKLVKQTKKQLLRGLPKVKPRTEGLVFGEDGCLRLARTAMGWGVVAARDIEPYTLLLRERPLVAALFVDPSSTKSMDKLFRIGTFFPQAPSKEAALTIPMLIRGVTDEWLANFAGPISSKDESILRDVLKVVGEMSPQLLRPAYAKDTIRLAAKAYAVVRANSFSISTPIVGVDYASVLYDQTSLFNHSCCANATVFAQGRTDSLDHLAVSVERIPAGREIFVSYGHSWVCRVEYRRQSLRRIFGFDCGCQRCLREIKSQAGLGPIRCDPEVHRLNNRAFELQRAGRQKEAVILLADVLANRKEALAASDPDIRNQVIAFCVRHYFKWGSILGEASSLDLKHLSSCMDEADFEHSGVSTAAHLTAFGHLLRCARVAAESDPGDLEPYRDLVAAFRDAVACLDRVYGKGNYCLDADVALSAPFCAIYRVARTLVTMIVKE